MGGFCEEIRIIDAKNAQGRPLCSQVVACPAARYPALEHVGDGQRMIAFLQEDRLAFPADRVLRRRHRDNEFAKGVADRVRKLRWNG